jgi:uncharacterized membrane protein
MDKKLIMPTALIVSLMINAFLLGVFVSGFKDGGKGPHRSHKPHRPQPEKQLYEAARELDEEIKEAVIAILDEQTPLLKEHMSEGRDSFDNLKSVLTAPELDFDALDKAFAKISDHHVDMSAKISSMLLNVAKTLPNNEERIDFFNRAMDHKPPFPGHDDKKHHPDRKK